jgi:fumarate hydratase class II
MDFDKTTFIAIIVELEATVKRLDMQVSELDTKITRRNSAFSNTIDKYQKRHVADTVRIQELEQQVESYQAELKKIATQPKHSRKYIIEQSAPPVKKSRIQDEFE